MKTENEATILTPTMKLRWSKKVLWDGSIGTFIRRLEQLHIDDKGTEHWIEIEIES